jgi:hypothetical protein
LEEVPRLQLRYQLKTPLTRKAGKEAIGKVVASLIEKIADATTSYTIHCEAGSIEYNYLNKPVKYFLTNGTLEYVYDATRGKIAKTGQDSFWGNRHKDGDYDVYRILYL